MCEEYRINKIYLRRHDTKKYDLIKRCPYYISLVKKSPRIFTNYVNLSKYQSSKKSAVWKNFLEIYKSIKRYGYDCNVEDKIKITYSGGKLKCKQGRHRICMLYKIHGRKLILICLDGEVVGFKLA